MITARRQIRRHMEMTTHRPMETSPRHFQLRHPPVPNAIAHALTGTRDDCDGKSCDMRYLPPCAGVAELADAQDLKSWVPKGACGFDSRPRHFGIKHTESSYAQPNFR